VRKFIHLAAFLGAIFAYMIVHEGTHAILAAIWGEYKAIRFSVIGPEVIFQTAVENRSGWEWALISGSSNFLTVGIGLVLLRYRNVFISRTELLIRSIGYYLNLVMLLADPINLSLGALVYGGNAAGIACGLGVPPAAVHILGFGVLAINREIAASWLLPAYKVERAPFILKPWFTKEKQMNP